MVDITIGIQNKRTIYFEFKTQISLHSPIIYFIKITEL
jgi:hypothetical protein